MLHIDVKLERKDFITKVPITSVNVLKKLMESDEKELIQEKQYAVQHPIISFCKRNIYSLSSIINIILILSGMLLKNLNNKNYTSEVIGESMEIFGLLCLALTLTIYLMEKGKQKIPVTEQSVAKLPTLIPSNVYSNLKNEADELNIELNSEKTISNLYDEFKSWPDKQIQTGEVLAETLSQFGIACNFGPRRLIMEYAAIPDLVIDELIPRHSRL